MSASFGHVEANTTPPEALPLAVRSHPRRHAGLSGDPDARCPGAAGGVLAHGALAEGQRPPRRRRVPRGDPRAPAWTLPRLVGAARLRGSVLRRGRPRARHAPDRGWHG